MRDCDCCDEYHPCSLYRGAMLCAGCVKVISGHAQGFTWQERQELLDNARKRYQLKGNANGTETTVGYHHREALAVGR